MLPLTSKQIAIVRQVSELDWSQIEPAIFGALFERGLDPDKRAQLGAHYTDRASIEMLIEPVVIAPLRREFETMKGELQSILERPTKDAATQTKRRSQARQRLLAFLDRLKDVRVLDPACGLRELPLYHASGIEEPRARGDFVGVHDPQDGNGAARG